MAAAVTLRQYQLRIVDSCMRANTVVLLPTGAGKTLIAAEAILRMHKTALFLVPTIPLVAQQAAALRSCPGMLHAVGEYHGGLTVPRGVSILVTTPKAFETAQQRGEPTFAWSTFGTVVFDEVHHVIKDHPFRSLAMKLRASGSTPRVIGLTASLTYAVGKEKINKSVQKLCTELCIEKIEHASDEELKDGGYRGGGRGAIAEIRELTTPPRSDVVPLQDRKPHLMHATFFARIDQGRATPFSLALIARVREIESTIGSTDLDFRSPLGSASLKTWGQYAHARAERSVALAVAYHELEHWYEALRLLVISWEEGEDLAVLFLRMMFGGNNNDAFLASQPTTFDRFENMADVLLEKATEASDSFRGILFVRQRISTHIVQHYLSQDTRLQSFLRSRCLYATSSPATASLVLTRHASDQALLAFASGDANLLISTSVAEEGLDVPGANCVIYLDPIDHAVSYVQGRGRARQEHSSFVMLSQRADRPASLLAQQEREQHVLVSSFSPANAKADTSAEITAQTSRERGARPVLFEELTDSNALSLLNLYCKKTKVDCKECATTVATQTHCSLTYESVLRKVSVKASGQSKKQAKKEAAVSLIRALQALA